MSKTQEQIAREWAENRMSIKSFTNNPTLEAVAEVVMRHTKPATMRDVVWDPKKHRGLGATDGYGNEWVMLKWNGADRIVCATPDLEKVHTIARLNLTPNGKRYKFTAEGEGGHEVLGTIEDYREAPDGTVVLIDNGHALTKRRAVWVGARGSGRTPYDLGGVERRVARWGWGS